jgi:hypothetical protein
MNAPIASSSLARVIAIGAQLALSSAFLCACDPGYRVEVRTVDRSGTPVPGVQLELHCPALRVLMVEFTEPLGITDGARRYSYEGIGEIGMHCVLRATNNGSKPVAVRDACRRVRPIFGSCLDVNATVVAASR